MAAPGQIWLSEPCICRCPDRTSQSLVRAHSPSLKLPGAVSRAHPLRFCSFSHGSLTPARHFCEGLPCELSPGQKGGQSSKPLPLPCPLQWSDLTISL